MTYSINRVTLILVVLIFFPAVLPFGTNGINFMEIISFGLMPFIVSYFIFVKKKVDKHFLLVLLFLFSVTFSYIFGAIFFNRGFEEPFTMYVGILKIVSFYFFGYFVAKNNSYNIIENSAKYYFLILTIFGIFQIYFVPIKEFVNIFYNTSLWNPVGYDIATTTFYHNVYFIFGISILAVLMQKNEKFIQLSIASLLGFLIILFFSLYASNLTVLIGFTFLYFCFIKNKIKYMLLILFSILFLYIVSNYEISHELLIIKDFITQYFSGNFNLHDLFVVLPALANRFEDTLVKGLNAFSLSPIFGIGPGGSMDSLYIDMLGSFGIFGTLIFIILIISILFRENTNNKKIIFLLILFLIYAIFQKSFFAGKSAEILWLLFGILDRTYSYRRNQYIMDKYAWVR